MSSLDRFRTALKFSLWTWALYWPGGGLILLQGGLDPVSLAVTLGSLAVFIALVAGGALRANSSRSVREFFLERPIYLVAGLVVFIAFAGLFPGLESLGLLIFASTWFGGLGLAAWRLIEHVRGEGLTMWKARADQALIVFALVAFFSMLVFLDALLPHIAGVTLGSSTVMVAVGSWVNLLYPPMVLVATRPFREPLSWVRRRPAKEELPALPDVVLAD